MFNRFFILALLAALTMEFVSALECFKMKKGKLETIKCTGDDNACAYDLEGGVKTASLDGCDLMPSEGLDENVSMSLYHILRFRVYALVSTIQCAMMFM